MQSTIKKISLIVFLFLASLHLANAQKYAHMNLGNLLTELDEVKAAEKELETYRMQMMSVGQDMVKNYEVVLTAAQESIAKNEWSPSRIQQEQAKLQQSEQQILQYEQEIIQKVQLKRQELLEPILIKIQATIEEVSKAEGYDMVFDTSIFNAVLFAKESEDISAKVLAKLQ